MRLRVLTLNVWGLPPGLARHREIRMRAIGERFIASAEDDSSPDVIALQEVWTRGARQILVAAGRRAGYNSLWHREAAFGGRSCAPTSRNTASPDSPSESSTPTTTAARALRASTSTPPSAPSA